MFCVCSSFVNCDKCFFVASKQISYMAVLCNFECIHHRSMEIYFSSHAMILLRFTKIMISLSALKNGSVELIMTKQPLNLKYLFISTIHNMLMVYWIQITNSSTDNLFIKVFFLFEWLQ